VSPSEFDELAKNNLLPRSAVCWNTDNLKGTENEVRATKQWKLAPKITPFVDGA
jgi:hypothetical protein